MKKKRIYLIAGILSAFLLSTGVAAAAGDVLNVSSLIIGDKTAEQITIKKGELWRGSKSGGRATSGETNAVVIKDDVKVKGTAKFEGDITLQNGNDLDNTLTAMLTIDSAVVDVLGDRRENIYYLSNYLRCVAGYAQYTTYTESDDVIFCWNLWIAGNTFPATPSSISTSVNTLQSLKDSGTVKMEKLNHSLKQ